MDKLSLNESVSYLMNQFEDGLVEMVQDSITAPVDESDEAYEQAQEIQQEIYTAFVKRLFDLYGPVEFTSKD